MLDTSAVVRLTVLPPEALLYHSATAQKVSRWRRPRFRSGEALLLSIVLTARLVGNLFRMAKRVFSRGIPAQRALFVSSSLLWIVLYVVCFFLVTRSVNRFLPGLHLLPRGRKFLGFS